MDLRIRTPFYMFVLARRREEKRIYILFLCLVRHWHLKRAQAKYAMTSLNSKWKYEKISRQATSSKRRGTWSFRVVILQRTVQFIYLP